MKVLAIETSCDETGIALVEGVARDPDAGGATFEFTVVDSVLLSQAALHAPYGGVFPNLAKREHAKNLPVLLEQLLTQTQQKFSRENFYGVEAIAVTQGPGLEPALWTGIVFAEALAKEWGVPLIPVNHMEGHLISSLARLKNNKPQIGIEFELKDVQLPVLGLLISGGHTEFVLMRNWFEYEIVGQTLDDAVGEAFDKVARMLELSYPGGPEISKLAQQHRSLSLGETSGIKNIKSVTWQLPRPMLTSKNCDVSFSGLKTAALYALRDLEKSRSYLNNGLPKVGPLTQEEKAAFAAEFEDAVAEVFVAKTRRALEETGAQTFVIGGGVAANRYMREKLEQLVLNDFPDVELRLPELSITGDNAIMIAEAALARTLAGVQQPATEPLRAIGNLSISTVK